MIVDIPSGFHPWMQDLGQIKDPASWHDIPWHDSFRYQILVEFMSDHVWGPDHDVPYYFQIEPNLRIHPPAGPGIAPHRDGDFGHQLTEWNVWIPLTEITEPSQGIWREVTASGLRQCVNIKLGQAFIFEGARTLHGSILNTTQIERRSFDFRLIAQADYKDTGRTTVAYGVPLRLGDYWR